MSDIDIEEWCPTCERNTLHRSEHEKARGPGVFYRLKKYCRDCGGMTRELSFK